MPGRLLAAGGVVVVLSVACVPQPQPSLLTATGKPEVTVAGVTPGAVESNLVDVMVAQGYRVASVTPTMAVFEKDAGILASVLLGSRYDAIPKIRVTCTLLELNGAVRVLADGAYITNPGSAFERRTDANSSKDMQQLQGVLEGVRTRLASAAPPATGVAREVASAPPPATAAAAASSPPSTAAATSKEPTRTEPQTHLASASSNAPRMPSAASDAAPPARVTTPPTAPASAQPDRIDAGAAAVRQGAAATEPRIAPGSGVAVQVRVTTPGFVVGDPPTPVSRYAVLIVGPAHDSTIVRTDAAGVAALTLPPGHYRIAPYKPATGPGGPYSWDLAFDVAPGMPAVELNADNARARSR